MASSILKGLVTNFGGLGYQLWHRPLSLRKGNRPHLPNPDHTEQYTLTLTDSSSSYSPSKSNKALAFGVRLAFFIVDSGRNRNNNHLK